MRVIICFLLCIFSSPLLAAEYTAGGNEKCRMTRNIPAPDVEYKGGEDVHGWAVAPADLTPNPWQESLGKEAPAAELRLPLENYVNKDSYNVDLSETELNMGVLQPQDGSVTLNGQPLEQDTDAYYDPACLKEQQKER